MMMFGIYDIKGEFFFTPFFERSRETAIRALAVQFSEDSMISNYPEDYVLYRLADFDVISGAVTNCEKEKICRIDEIYMAQKRHDENGGSLYV